jgi:hypothetical protein
MITPGKYSAWIKTPVGEGSGVVTLHENGDLRGGDSTFSYFGHWTQSGNQFRASWTARRTTPGPPGVFGMDEIDMVAAGLSDGPTLTATGFAKQAPGLKLEIELISMANDD